MLSENKVCSYVNNNTYFHKKYPSTFAKIDDRKICKQEKLKISTELLEYNNMSHLPILFYALENKKFKKIIIFFIQSININKNFIKKFIIKTKKFNEKIYFANENIKLNSLKTEKILKNLL